MTALATTPLAPEHSPTVDATTAPDPRGHALVLLRGGAAADAGTSSAADRAAAAPADPANKDALATALMDLFRRTRSREAFDALVGLTRDQLLARVHSRLRYLGQAIDPHELLQDAYINIYCYPDKFDASRPGAFRAWSTTIVDNSVRRYLRKSKSGPDVRLQPIEILAQEADEPDREPGCQAILSEQYREAARVFQLFLGLYLASFKTLSERERFVLQMVEVRGLRYAQLAEIVGIRPEALKMVVFRARKRIARRIQELLAPVAA